jgi:hypothetical protein
MSRSVDWPLISRRGGNKTTANTKVPRKNGRDHLGKSKQVGSYCDRVQVLHLVVTWREIAHFGSGCSGVFDVTNFPYSLSSILEVAHRGNFAANNAVCACLLST